MPRGDKSSYTAKQKRKAEHIEKGYEKKGVSHKEAEERAWRTVNKQDGGGRKGDKLPTNIAGLAVAPLSLFSGETLSRILKLVD